MTIELACDESGAEGQNLVEGNTSVFAHASIRTSLESAADIVLEMRDRIRSPATEYKANHLLRQKNRSALKWFLEPSGPIATDAHVHLIDKAFLATVRVVDLLLGENTFAATFGLVSDQRIIDQASVLYRDGQVDLGAERWQSFLIASNSLMRSKYAPYLSDPVDYFFRTAESLLDVTVSEPVAVILKAISESRTRAERTRRELLSDPKSLPWPLDPLLPALGQTALHWSANGRSLSIVHDEQSAITPGRLAEMNRVLAGLRGVERGPLTKVVRVDSMTDSRVQVADFLAGVARKIAEEELEGRGDPELTELLRPYLDAASLWADDRSARTLFR